MWMDAEDHAVHLDDEGFYKSLDDFYKSEGGLPRTKVEPSKSDEDVVETPSHYARWVIEPATFIMTNAFEFWRGNIVKYACRAGYKQYDGQDMIQSEITDLKKIIRYAEMRIEQLESM
jgi:hypothetical protein